MIRVPPGAVMIDADETAFVAGALELLAECLAAQRSQPTPRLRSLTAKLRKAAENTHGSGRTNSATASVRALQQDSVDDPPYAVMGTGDAARVLGITTNAARDLARRGRIPATSTGTRWQFDAAAVVARAERQAARRAR